jgi:tRNA(Ile)-lysidine synthetase-like protein
MPVITQEERLRRRIESKVRRFVQEERLLPDGDRLLVAVSGGPDSTALLLILSRLAPPPDIELTVAYFDHGLRGEAASRQEREAVERLTTQLGLALLTGRGDVRGEAKRRKTSIEAAARRLRYGFLASAATEAGCSAVATGHTLDDQAETVLMHIVRGAGLQGLAGMGPRSRWPFPETSPPGPLSASGEGGQRDKSGEQADRTEAGIELVRPLLTLRRAETLAYCEAAGIHPVHDESNESRTYQRNRVRHELLPALRRFNPRVEEALGRLAEAARSETESSAGVALKVSAQGGDVILERSTLAALSPALRREAFTRAFDALLGGHDGVSARHYSALDRLVRRGSTGDQLDLPRGVVAELRRDGLVLVGRQTEQPALTECTANLSVPGEVRFGPLIVRAGKTAPDDCLASAQLDAGAVGDRLLVRRRRPGDRLRPAGMSGTKKLQDLFVDVHVPRRERDAIPIFENEQGIAWVGGLRIAEWAKRRDGEPTVTLSYRRI